MLNLKTEKREVFGKHLKEPRKHGKMPAVLYGKKEKTTPLFVDLKEFKKIWKEAGESTIIKVQTDGKECDAIIQLVDLDPIKDEPIHADFYAVQMDKPITVAVEFVFEGVAPAEKELGGVVVKVMHEAEVEALPKDLPKELKIDLSKLVSFEDQIMIKDIELPKGVKILAKENEVVALVEEAQGEVIEEPARTIEDVVVEKKGKKEEESAEEAK